MKPVRPSAAPPLLAPEVLNLLGKCISHLNDIVLITEAEPFDAPGPRIVFVNEAFERNTGYSPVEVLGETPRLFQGPKTDAVELRRIGAALRRWEIVRTELVNYKKCGEPYWVEMEIVPVADASGYFTHWVSIQRNVTARKLAESEARLHELQRTQSLGTLAAGVAHDFNNIIAAILGNVAIAQRNLLDGVDGLPPLAQIQSAGLRARQLVQQILAYSRHEPPTFTCQSLGAIVLEATDLLRATLPSGIRLQVDVADDTLMVEANATMIQQVLLNLGTNAWHAMQGGNGRIDVECSLEPAPATACAGEGGATPAAAPRFALVTVGDDGCGMDDATSQRIFDPYFTTKPIGQGTGLGLSVAWGILKSHGATIEVDSRPGAGARFTIRFPLLEGAVELPPPPLAAARQSWGHGRRVLLVDDDDVVLLMLEGVLKTFGFQVLPFNDPIAALAALGAQPERFDIVVTDHNMPMLSGIELAARAIEITPGMPVLITSGYVDAALTEAARRVGAADVFPKEYSAEALADSVAQILRRRAPADSPA